VYKGERFQNDAILDVKTHYKPTETFQYTHYSFHPPGVKRGFIKGEAIRLLRTNSSEKNFLEAMCNCFKTRLEARGYPKSLIERTMSEVSFAERQSAFKKQTKQTKGKILPFVTTYHPGVKNLKTNTGAKMESHPKSATAESNLQNTSDHIIQKR